MKIRGRLNLFTLPDSLVFRSVVAGGGLSIHQFKHDGTAWQPEYYLAGVEAQSITIDGNGNPWFAATDGQLHSW